MHHFNILIRRKIPYLSSVLWGLLVVLLLAVFISYLAMLPAIHASGEMNWTYYLLAIPQPITILGVIGVAGLIVFVRIYFAARLCTPGVFYLESDKIIIKAKNIDLHLKPALISKIFINELKNAKGEALHNLQIVLQPKYSSQLVFQLKDYADSDLFIQTISKLENVQLSWYDDNMVTMHHNE